MNLRNILFLLCFFSFGVNANYVYKEAYQMTESFDLISCISSGWIGDNNDMNRACVGSQVKVNQYLDGTADYANIINIKYANMRANLSADNGRSYSGGKMRSILYCEDASITTGDSCPKVNFCETLTFNNDLREQAGVELGCSHGVDSTCYDSDNYLFECASPPQNTCNESSDDFPSCCSAENNYCDEVECNIFSPKWPACSDIDINVPIVDPVAPPPVTVTPPTVNPPEVEQPDVEENTPDVTYDNTNLIKAVENFNADNNQLLTSINNEIVQDNAFDQEILTTINENIAEHALSTNEGINSLIEVGNNQITGVNLSNEFLGSIDGKLTSIFDHTMSSLNNRFTVTPSQNSLDGLYTNEQLTGLDSEITKLKEEYEQVLADFRNYFSLNTNLNNGEFDAHNLKLTWRGREISQNNVALKTLVDNAAIISAVILFIFGFAGIRLIIGSV